MPELFKQWFCLKNRESFTIDPKINPKDARFYFGRAPLEARLKQQITRAFVDPQVPKMIIWGPYGSGKTQTLYHLAHWLENNTPNSCKGVPHIVHVDIEVQSKSMADSWHLQLTEALEMGTVKKWIDELRDRPGNFDEEVGKLTSDANIVNALKLLRGGGEIAFTTWRWLTGQKLGAKELQEIRVTRNLTDVGVGDMVGALLALGNLARSVGRCLIFCIDEMEELRNVKVGDAAESWHQYTRKLTENANSSVGLLIGFFANTIDEAPQALIRGDVRGRIGQNNYIEMEILPAPANVNQFVTEMLSELLDVPKAEALIQAEQLQSTAATFPFSATAFELLCDYACQDAIKSTPRNIIKTINECAIATWDKNMHIIDDDVVNEIAPIVFG
jgi:DNA polymerase III delta prime subunit